MKPLFYATDMLTEAADGGAEGSTGGGAEGAREGDEERTRGGDGAAD